LSPKAQQARKSATSFTRKEILKKIPGKNFRENNSKCVRLCSEVGDEKSQLAIFPRKSLDVVWSSKYEDKRLFECHMNLISFLWSKKMNFVAKIEEHIGKDNFNSLNQRHYNSEFILKMDGHILMVSFLNHFPCPKKYYL
jgi:hypothetical protein